MKFVKTMLLMTVAAGAVANGHDCGTYVRGQIGGSQGIQANRDSSLPASLNPTKSNKFGVYGGLGVESRMSLSHYHPNLVGGFGVDANLESTKYKQKGKINATTTLASEVKRQVVINVLGQLGWKIKHNLTPYLTAGASYTQFKFSNTLTTSTGATYAASKKKNIVGWAGGAGLSWGINQKWTTDIRYLYSAYGTTKTNTSLNTQNNTAKAPNAYHAVTLGVSYKI